MDRSDIAGIVSFHGAVGPAASGKPIKAKILALHGADDPFVPPDEVKAFEDEMRKANADWQLVAYGNSVHSFTDWNAGNDNSKGAAYNEKVISIGLGSSVIPSEARDSLIRGKGGDSSPSAAARNDTE